MRKYKNIFIVMPLMQICIIRWLLFNFFFILFMIVTEREREAETQAEGEAGSMHREPDVGFDPGSPGSRPGPKAGAKPLRHPGIPGSVPFLAGPLLTRGCLHRWCARTHPTCLSLHVLDPPFHLECQPPPNTCDLGPRTGVPAAPDAPSAAWRPH